MQKNCIRRLRVNVVSVKIEKIKRELLELKTKKIISVDDKYKIQKLQQQL